MDGHTLRIGTRGSKLALWQAERVRSLLGVAAEIVVIKTSGDQLKDVPLQGQSTMGFFTREIERALGDHEIDLAVHSLKDLPVEQPDNLVLAAILERHAPSDLLLVHPAVHDPEQELPVALGSRVGAGSLRRSQSLGALRGDLEAVLVRGNVPTRVAKTVRREVDAMVIARAGVERLGLDTSPLLPFELEPTRWIPAPGQAAVTVEVRRDDHRAADALRGLDHGPTRECVELERKLLKLAGGGCHAPFGAWARLDGAELMQVCVGAQARDGQWRQAYFRGNAGSVQAEATRWFEAGCAEVEPPEIEEKLCRPARPWY